MTWQHFGNARARIVAIGHARTETRVRFHTVRTWHGLSGATHGQPPWRPTGSATVIEEFAARERMRVTRTSPNTFVMNHGSTQGIAPSACGSNRAHCLKAYIETNAAPGGTRISVRIEETWAWLSRGKVKEDVRRIVRQWLQALREAIPALRRPAVQGQDIAGEFARLAELHAQGVITEEEFSSAKAAVLARPDATGSSP